MGNNYQARYIIGLKIPTDKLFETKTRVEFQQHPSMRKKDCPHIPRGDEWYCPECGSEVKRAVPYSELKDEFLNAGEFEGFERTYDSNGKAIAGWTVSVGPVDDYNHYVCLHYVETKFTRGYVEEKVKHPIIAGFKERKEEFIADMKRLGLWELGEFGTWLQIYLSY